MVMYPTSDFHKLQPLLSAMGSFWADINRDPFIMSFLKSQLRQSRQLYMDYLEAIDSISYNTCPIFHKEEWTCIVVLKSKMGQGEASLIKYGAGGMKYDGSYIYGQYKTDVISSKLDYELVSAATISDKVLNPTFLWVHGTDFFLDPEHDSIIFVQNPFDFVHGQPVFDENGEIVDEVITLWICDAEFDHQTLYKQWGYIIQTPGLSNQFYKNFLKASFDAVVGVGSALDLRKLLSAVFGVPVANSTEVIKDIKALSDKLVVVTDEYAYTFPAGSTALVSIGDVVIEGQSLVDTVELVELTSQTAVDALLSSNKWPAITLSSEFLSGNFFSSITFENKLVNVEWRTDDARFIVHGWPGDIEEFWEAVHMAGVQYGKRLADLLDTRTNRPTPAISIHMPAQVNPMEFILTNFLKNNAIFARIRVNLTENSGLLAETFKIIRQNMPPGVALLVFNVFDAVADGYNVLEDTAEALFEAEISPLIESMDLAVAASDQLTIKAVKGCVS